MLTRRQKRHFYEEGYVVVPGAVPRLMVDAARQAINHSVGSVGVREENSAQYRPAALCDELRSQALMTGLFNNASVIGAAESMIGEGNLHPAGGVQIALRFPGAVGTDAGEPHGHLDGLGSGTNGTPKGEYVRGFTALAVIYLGDVPEPYSGNFTVWPKSHTFFRDYFTENGHGVLAEGMPRVELPEPPVQITGSAGDLVLAHHQIVHTAAPNGSANIRYAAITRLRHLDIKENGPDVYTDIWREYPGLRAEFEQEAA
jgi:hypothetical protein